eukprot:TRINITY_DN851_c0_g1_i2.p1 TRINITY_DN851_c0_g1~~TRINITY_DN851_c0_g1_i2.p1  ORF type:complete len:616 (+),score=106.08 TRINITY_DN851_c0_g1_i2:640-2487(+)
MSRSVSLTPQWLSTQTNLGNNDDYRHSSGGGNASSSSSSRGGGSGSGSGSPVLNANSAGTQGSSGAGPVCISLGAPASLHSFSSASKRESARTPPRPLNRSKSAGSGMTQQPLSAGGGSVTAPTGASNNIQSSSSAGPTSSTSGQNTIAGVRSRYTKRSPTNTGAGSAQTIQTGSGSGTGKGFDRNFPSLSSTNARQSPPAGRTPAAVEPVDPTQGRPSFVKAKSSSQLLGLASKKAPAGPAPCNPNPPSSVWSSSRVVAARPPSEEHASGGAKNLVSGAEMLRARSLVPTVKSKPKLSKTRSEKNMRKHGRNQSNGAKGGGSKPNNATPTSQVHPRSTLKKTSSDSLITDLRATSALPKSKSSSSPPLSPPGGTRNESSPKTVGLSAYKRRGNRTPGIGSGSQKPSSSWGASSFESSPSQKNSSGGSYSSHAATNNNAPPLNGSASSASRVKSLRTSPAPSSSQRTRTNSDPTRSARPSPATSNGNGSSAPSSAAQSPQRPNTSVAPPPGLTSLTVRPPAATSSAPTSTPAASSSFSSFFVKSTTKRKPYTSAFSSGVGSPPSNFAIGRDDAAEQRLLRQLGWDDLNSDTDEGWELTDEEIAAAKLSLEMAKTS